MGPDIVRAAQPDRTRRRPFLKHGRPGAIEPARETHAPRTASPLARRAAALLMLVGAPFANRVHALVLGLPFLLFWIVGACC